MYNWIILKLIGIEKSIQTNKRRHNSITYRIKWKKHYGIKHNIKWENKIIFYGDIWDSTKGYPGEGPINDISRGKKRTSSTSRGDILWAKTLHMWADIPKIHMQNIGAEHTLGHDLWYKKSEPIRWDKLHGNMISVNMAGWGDRADREMMWTTMARTKTMVMVLQDHRRQTGQINNMQMEIENAWLGEKSDRKAAWAYTTGNQRIGGVAIAIHPALARYAKQEQEWCDTRGWGRWTAIELKGRKRNIVIIGTYGPTPNDDEESENAMWQQQLKGMEKIPMHERADDPRAQYMYDLNILLARLRKKNYQVILAGDTNINLHKQATSVRTWKTMMEEHNMKNTMATWWPRMIHKLTTWGRTKKKNYWIDHIYMTNTMIKEGSLIGAGIETGHNFYSSDHNMIGININWTKALGRIPELHKHFTPRKRVVRATIEDNKLHYQEIGIRRAAKQCKPGNGGDINQRTAKLLEKATKMGRTGSKKERKHMQKQMNILMQ